jgi:integrase
VAQKTERLTVKGLQGLAVGLHADGGGLYLRVEPTGARRWLFLFRHRGKRCEMGLGSQLDVGMASAREAARQARMEAKGGKNPIEERRQRLAAAEAAKAAVPFGELMDQLVASKAPQWTSEITLHQWQRSAEIEAKALRPLMPAAITTEDILAVLKPVWIQTPESARRLQGRLEFFLDAAKVKGLRQGENPARWKGHLELLLPRRSKLSRQHHAAVPFDQAKAFFAKLRRSESISALALDLTILTVCRTTEVLAAAGSEFDIAQALWTIPAARMKSRREHRVPLSAPALAIVKQRVEICGDGLLFPGLVRGRPLSNMAMLKMMALLGYGAFTVHGWRATFRTWGQERTNFPRELLELTLAHLVGDDTERAYNRGDGLDRRRQLMEAWAGHCEPAANNVIRIA